MSSLKTLELKVERVRKARALAAMFFVALAVLFVLVSPTKVNAQSVVGITVPKGTKIDVTIIGDTGKCQCAEPVVKKPTPKPVVKKYVAPKPDPRELVLKSMRYSADSLSAALRIASVGDSLRRISAPKVRTPMLSSMPMRFSADIRLHFTDTLVVKHIFVDACPNIVGVQATVPVGMILDAGGNCVRPPKNNHATAWVVGTLVTVGVAWIAWDNRPKHTTNNYYACTWVNGKQVCPNGGPVNAPNGMRAGISVPFRP